MVLKTLAHLNPFSSTVSLENKNPELFIIIQVKYIYICHGQKSRFFGDGHPTFNDGILIMGPYKPLRTWVEFPIPYYMEMSWELIDQNGTYHIFWELKGPSVDLPAPFFGTIEETWFSFETYPCDMAWVNLQVQMVLQCQWWPSICLAIWDFRNTKNSKFFQANWSSVIRIFSKVYSFSSEFYQGFLYGSFFMSGKPSRWFWEKMTTKTPQKVSVWSTPLPRAQSSLL